MKVHTVITEHYIDTYVMSTPQIVQYSGEVQTKLETM